MLPVPNPKLERGRGTNAAQTLKLVRSITSTATLWINALGASRGIGMTRDERPLHRETSRIGPDFALWDETAWSEPTSEPTRVSTCRDGVQ